MKRILALTIVLSWLIAGGRADAQPSDEESAKTHFYRAVEFYKKGQYADALVDFEASFKFRPHWKVRYNLGMCHYLLGHLVEAGEQLAAFLEEGGDEVPEDQKNDSLQNLVELKKKVAVLKLIGEVEEAQVTIDGQEVKNPASGREIFLAPGTHAILVVQKGKAVIDEETTFQAGTSKEMFVGVVEVEKIKTVTVPVEPKDEKPDQKSVIETPGPKPGGKMRTAAWATMAVGAALLVTGAVTGGLVFKEKNEVRDLEDKYRLSYDEGASDTELQDILDARDEHLDRGYSLIDATNVLLPVGGALVVTAIVLFAVSATKLKERKKAGAADLRIGPSAFLLEVSF